MKRNFKKMSGYSLLELMVVFSIFGIISVLTTQTLLLTIRGAKKSDVSSNVKTNVEFAIASMERQIRNADSFNECPNTNVGRIDYTDSNGTLASYSCQDISGNGYIASESARLTSESVNVTQCSFTCIPEKGDLPSSVTITISAKDNETASGESGSSFTTMTRIFTRSY